MTINKCRGRIRRQILIFSALLAAGCSATGENPRVIREFQDCEICPIMVMLPAGTFLMGTAEEDRLIDPRTGKPATNDGPQHQVDISNPFSIGKYEVTVGQFRAFIEATGYEPVDRCMEFSKKNSFEIRKDVSWDNPGFEQSEDAPVGCISFFDAEAYANWLAGRTGAAYRLPTEAEWEYAARAGSTTSYFWGTSEAEACKYANVRSAGAWAISSRQAEADARDGFPCDDRARQSSPVGQYEPNAFGLHDMQGNAWEWVADCIHKNYAGAPTDGSAWLDDGGCRFGVIRGGSYLNLVERSSTTVRVGRPRSGGATNMGFRVARGGQAADAATQAFVYEARADISPGALLFADNCAACHETPEGLEGLYGKDQASLVKVISDGGNNIMSMPAFADRMTADEIETVAEYLRRINNWN
jgi:formylglycine-generating enzyme required for sulfatase activity